MTNARSLSTAISSNIEKSQSQLAFKVIIENPNLTVESFRRLHILSGPLRTDTLWECLPHTITQKSLACTERLDPLLHAFTPTHELLCPLETSRVWQGSKASVYHSPMGGSLAQVCRSNRYPHINNEYPRCMTTKPHGMQCTRCNALTDRLSSAGVDLGCNLSQYLSLLSMWK